ncbi:hypothetical protein MAUB1S_08876 [Mycolicibacterium aubagnense]
MADYFTHFSCLLDVGTPQNAARALDLYNALMAENALEDPPSDGFVLSIEPEHGGSRLWMRDDGTGDPQSMITFVLRCAEVFDLQGRWGFQWAGTCSRPRVNAFSGGAHVLDLATRQTIAWIGTHGWLADNLAEGDVS